MKVNMNNYSQSFNGLLRYKNNNLKTNATIDTKNIIGIQQKYDNDYTESEYSTDIIVKNTFDNKETYPYLVFSFNMPIDDVIKQYNKACRNENAELNSLNNISSYNTARNDKLVE